MLGRISDWKRPYQPPATRMQGGGAALGHRLDPLGLPGAGPDGKLELSQGAPFEEIYVRDRTGGGQRSGTGDRGVT